MGMMVLYGYMQRHHFADKGPYSQSYIYIYFFFPQFVVIHTVKGFCIINKAEVDIFLEISCFFNHLTDVDSLISGSSAFSKSSLNIWKFTVHILLKPGLENFEPYIASM